MGCDERCRLTASSESADEPSKVVSLRWMEAHLRLVDQTHGPPTEQQCDTRRNVRLHAIAFGLDRAKLRHLLVGQSVLRSRQHALIANLQAHAVTSRHIWP